MATSIFIKPPSPIKKGTPVPTTVVSPAKLRSAKLPFSQELARDIENLSTSLNALHSTIANTAQTVSIPGASVTKAGLVKPDGTSITVDSDGAIHGALLETNSVENGSQSKLNLVAGTNVALSDDGTGDINVSVPPVWETWTADEDASGFNLNNLNILGTSGIQVSGFLTFQNWASMNYTHGAATYMTTNNASGGAWPEFSYFLNPGISLAADIFNFAVNTRTTVGGADSWIDAMQITMLTAAVLFPTQTTFTLAPIFSDPAGTRTALGLGAVATQSTVPIANGGTGATTAAAALTNLLGSWTGYTPTVTGGGSMTVSGITITDAEYLKIGPLVFLKFHITCTLGGTLSNTVNFSLPVALVGDISKLDGAAAAPAATLLPVEARTDATVGVQVVGPSAGNYTAGAWSFLVSGFYRCA